MLVRSAGKVVDRDELSRTALGRRASSFDRSLDVHLSNLRSKLGPQPGGGDRIKTVRGVGYQYVRQQPARSDKSLFLRIFLWFWAAMRSWSPRWW